MGGGASSAAGFGAAASKMGESDLKDIVSAMDPETLEKLHKVVTEVAGTKASGKEGSPTAGDGAGNFKEASEMKRATLAWSSDIAFEALKEISLAEKMPMGITGKYLILDSVFKGEDDDKWKEMMKLCALLFLNDQAPFKAKADVPFVPPASAQEHALYLWDKETTDKNLEAAGLSPKGMTGRQRMRDFTEKWEDHKQVEDLCTSEAVKFMKAMAEVFPDELFAE